MYRMSTLGKKLGFVLAACSAFAMALSVAVAAPAGKSLAFADIKGHRYDFQTLSAHKASVFLFISSQCPIANVYTPRFLALAEKYDKQGVQVFAVYSDRQESLADVEKHAKERKLSFPVIRDAGA